MKCADDREEDRNYDRPREEKEDDQPNDPRAIAAKIDLMKTEAPKEESEEKGKNFRWYVHIGLIMVKDSVINSRVNDRPENEGH